jgi:hypothetical protein
MADRENLQRQAASAEPPAEEPPADLPEPPLDSGEAGTEAVSEAEPADEVSEAVVEETPGTAEGEPPATSGPRQVLVPSPSWFTLLLIVLNLLAGLALGYLLLLDYSARRTWSSALLLRDLVLWGLPLDDKEGRHSAAQEVRPVFRLEPEQLARAYQERVRGGKGGKFALVEEAIGQPIPPAQLSTEILQELFRGVPPPVVRTWKEEADRLQQDFFTKVQEAAEKLPGLFKDEAAKRRQLADLLLSLAGRPDLMDDLDKQIRELPAAQLDNWLRDAGQRWVLLNQLRLLAVLWPASASDNNPEEQKQQATQDLLAQAAHPGRVPLEQLQERLRSHFQEAQQNGTSFQRRQRLAFLLYSLSKARQPANPNEGLFDPQQSKRVAVVTGLAYYTLAAADLAQALTIEQKHLQTLLEQDRSGYAVQGADGQLRTVPGFVGRYQALVQRLLELAADINEQEARLKRLQELETRQEQQYHERSAHFDEVVARLLQARQQTAQLAAELRQLEEQLFRAQRERADAAQNNQELERQIRALEQRLLRRK